MSFLKHLEELRWHLFRSLICVCIVAILAFIFKSFIFNNIIFAPTRTNFLSYRLFCKFIYFINPQRTDLCIQNLNFELINISLSGQFMLHITASFIVGLVVSFPYILFELLRFAFPGLKQNEKKNIILFVGIGTFLFTIGILFGYFILSPLSIQFLGNYSISSDIQNRIYIRSFISTLALISFSSGLVFQIPLIVHFLSKAGFVSSKMLKKYWKYAVVIILVVSAIITPPDIASQVFLSIPIFCLYLCSIFIARKNEKIK